MSNSLEHWSLPLHTHKYAPKEAKESDWSSLFHLLPEWIAQAEQVFELIGSPDSEERTSLDSIKKVETEEVFKTLQQWVLTITNGTERDNVQLTQEVTNLHTSMVQYLVDILILLSPDYTSDPSDTKVVVGFDKEEFAATVPVQKMQEDSLTLSEKLNVFSSYITRSCQDMLENNPLDEDSGYELRQLEAIKSSCDEWTETCKLILSKVTDSAVPSEIRPQDPFISGNKANTQARMDKLLNNMVPTQDTMRIIGYDGNICKKSLLEVEIPISTEGVLKASRPSTPRSIQAFESLTSLQQLEKRLLHSEMRAQTAEERAENLDEQLKAALQRVQELELKSQSEESTMKEETPIHIEATSEKLSLPVPTKKRPKSSKTKQHK